MAEINAIIAECRTYTDTAHTHDHPYAQLILPLSGTLFIETTHQALQLNETRLFFLPPNCRHTFYAQDHNQFLVLDVPSYFTNDVDFISQVNGLNPPMDERWRAVRFLLLSEIERASDSSPALSELFRYAYQLLQQDLLPRSLQYIHARYGDPLTLQRLAALEGFNLTYYCEWFKKLTGFTPQAYIRQIRLRQAKELLTQTELPILRIAQQVGYEHHASLTRLFQQLEGVSPQVYRQQSRNSVKA